MNRRFRFASCVSLASATAWLLPLAFLPGNASAQTPKAGLEEVAKFPEQQVTGITVSKEGRFFVCFPFWSPDHGVSVAEITNEGTLQPYPSAAWNRNDGDPKSRFVCVQSVYVDDQDALWILDPAAPMLEKTVKDGPKLVKIDLATNSVVETIGFDEKQAPPRSYLNDVRVDTKNGFAFVTESGVGSLLVVDLKNHQARRVLVGSPATKLEVGKKIVVDGMELIDPNFGTPPQFQADGIALDQKSGTLYFHALTGRTLYKVSTADLTNPNLSDDDLVGKVVKVAETPAPDGMITDSQGRLYLTAIEQDAIVRFDPASGKLETVVADPRLQWPDTMSWGPDGFLYVTTSQIHRMPKYHDGESKRTEPYHIFRLKPQG